MEYCIVTSDGWNTTEVCEQLSKKVIELCNKGWCPQGGVSISKYPVGYENYISVAQAMVKK